MRGILSGIKRKDNAATGLNELGPVSSQPGSGPAAAASGNEPVNPVLNFGASGIKALYVRGFAGAVEIEAHDTPEVRFEVLGYEPRSTKLVVNLQGESLQIGLKSRFHPARPWSLILPLRCMLRVAVPRSLSLRCATTSGNIRVRGVTGDLVLETESGKVEVDAPCRFLAIVTETGDADLRGLVGPLSFKAASGWLKAAWAEVPDSGIIEIRKGKGVTELALPENACMRQHFTLGPVGFMNEFECDANARLGLTIASRTGNLAIRKIRSRSIE
jgi:hypothetical protein